MDAKDKNVDVTPQMIEAGYDVLSMFDSELGDKEETVLKIYKAMEEARQHSA